MAAITLTAKRQATFSRALCEELAIGPGDELLVERRLLDGETVWILRPKKVDWAWIGSVPVREGVSHDMDDVRASIGRGRASDRR